MVRSGFVTAGMALVCVAGVTVSGIAPAQANVLAPHRAVYDLELKDASERSGISGMYGRMVYEFNGSACSGYTVSFRFVTQVDTGDGVRMTDQQTTTFEDIRKGDFRFLTRSFTDDKLDKEVKGTAHDAEKSVTVALTEPDEKKLDLAASRFPTEHMLEVIEHARTGKRFFESRLFDGSDSGDKTLFTTTMVGEQEEPGAGVADDAARAGDLADDAYWPVTIAYFNDGEEGDGVPIYNMSFKLYGNGVTRDLTMDYGDFVLSGKLARLDLLKQEDCK